ncbi:MAG: cell division protein FtsA [Hyphomicrobiaceae bacterium]
MLRFSKKRSGRHDVVTLLDIGTSKICCMIVALEGDIRDWRPGQPLPARLLGLGHQRSRGIRAGVVDKIEEVEDALCNAVGQAERMAGITVDDVVISVSCGRLKSRNFAASVRLGGATVTRSDLDRVVAGAQRHCQHEGRSLVHLGCIGMRLDGVGPVADPTGMAGRVLSADMHAVTADDTPLGNLLMAVERAHLNVVGFVASPLASGLAATTLEERRVGVLCLDMGGGVTTLSVFADGHFLFTDAIAVGGSHMTFDIARALSTPVAEAERIKTLYGNVVGAASDETEYFSYPAVGDEETSLCQSSRARLREIVQARADLLFGLVEQRLEESGLAGYAGQRVVLTGGGSQLAGVGAYAADRLGKAVRVGRPAAVARMPESLSAPAFSTVVGLLHAVCDPSIEVRAYQEPETLATGTGSLQRVGQWIRGF